MEEKVGFNRDKSTFFLWWYMPALGKKIQDLSNKGFMANKKLSRQ